MGKMKAISWALVLILALTILPAVQATAAEGGWIWFHTSNAENGVTLSIYADTTVASGVFTLTYDKKALTFGELTVDSNFVAAHAINAKVPGKVVISWVAPANQTAAETPILMQLHFEGTDVSSFNLSGSANGLSGELISVGMLDFTALNQALEEAGKKTEQDYTADSFQALLAARDEAEALLKQEIVSPGQVAAATEKLNNAMAKLETPAPPTQPPTEPTGTFWENNGWIAIVIAAVAVCAAGAVVTIVVLKKRRNKECA